MPSINVKGYLDSKGWQYRTVGSEATLQCPFCGKDRFYINLETGAWLCQHKNSCGKRGNLFQLKQLLGDIEPKETANLYTSPSPAGSTLSEKAQKWFAERKISQNTLITFGIVQKGDAIVFPYIREGKLCNNKYRAPSKKFWQEKDAKQVLYAADIVPPEQKELIIVEGEIDALSLHEVGYSNVVSVPSGAGNLDWVLEEWEWLQRFTTIFICFDEDKAGRDGAEKAAIRLGTWRCRLAETPWNDANEGLVDGELTYDSFMDCLLQAKDMAPETYRIAESFAEEVIADDPPGLSTGFQRFDEILGGMREGEVTTFTGRNGSGKTTLALQVLLYMLQNNPDIHAGLASLEMLPKWLIRWMVKQTGQLVSRETVDSFFKDITQRRLHIVDEHQAMPAEELLSVFEYIARAKGAKLFIIDSLLRVNLVNGENYLEAQKDFMNRLCEFAMRYAAHIILVAHPRKGASDADRVQKVDIAGSGDISNLCHNVICLNRLRDEDGNDTGKAVLEVLKNRIGGREGAVKLKFDTNWKRFTEAQ